MELQCPECGCNYDVDAVKMEDDTCPECGFNSETCPHPISERDSKVVYDVGENQEVEQTICGQCGLPVSEM